MELFQYLVIGAAVLFLISLIWLINLTGNLDCLKTNSQVKSPVGGDGRPARTALRSDSGRARGNARLRSEGKNSKKCIDD